MNAKNAPPDLCSGAFYCGNWSNPRIINQAIQTTIPVFDFLHDPRPRGLVAHILRDEVCSDCFGVRFSCFQVDISRNDSRAFPCKQSRISGAKPGGATGYDDDFIFYPVLFVIRFNSAVREQLSTAPAAVV